MSSKLGCGGQLTKATLSCLQVSFSHHISSTIVVQIEFTSITSNTKIQDVPIERLMDVTSSPDPAADDQPAWGEDDDDDDDDDDDQPGGE